MIILLMAIRLVDISGYFINGYWRILADISGY